MCDELKCITNKLHSNPWLMAVATVGVATVGELEFQQCTMSYSYISFTMSVAVFPGAVQTFNCILCKQSICRVRFINFVTIDLVNCLVA